MVDGYNEELVENSDVSMDNYSSHNGADGLDQVSIVYCV